MKSGGCVCSRCGCWQSRFRYCGEEESARVVLLVLIRRSKNGHVLIGRSVWADGKRGERSLSFFEENRTILLVVGVLRQRRGLLLPKLGRRRRASPRDCIHVGAWPGTEDEVGEAV